jgi:predicted membrane protein
MFDRGVVHIVVAGYIVDHYCLMFDRGVLHIVVVGYIVDLYCLRFNRGVVHIVVAVILLTITVSGLTEVWFILLWLAILLTILLFEVWLRSGLYCCGCLYC